MALPKAIICMISEKAGYDIDTPAGANRLSIELDADPKVRLGRNTICRLTGVLQSDCQPRLSTLNRVARYLGYSNWVSFLEKNPALKVAYYSAHPKFKQTYGGGQDSSTMAKYSIAYAFCDGRAVDVAGWDFSQWSSWTGYSQPMSV